MKNVIPAPVEVMQNLDVVLGKIPQVKVSNDIYIKLHGCWYIIPKGFVSDGASIPWIFTLFIDRLDANIILFSILHDYFYRTQFVPRFYADSIYESGLAITKGLMVSRSFYAGLRVGGGVAWKNNKKKGLEKHPEAYQRLINHICKVEKTEIQK